MAFQILLPFTRMLNFHRECCSKKEFTRLGVCELASRPLKADDSRMYLQRADQSGL